MRKIFRIYWRGLENFRLLSFFCVLATGLSGLLEGTALMFLIPILGQGMNSSTRSPLPSFFGTFIARINHGKISLFLAFMVISAISAFIRLVADGLTLYIRNSVEKALREKIGRVLFYVSWPYFLTQRLGNVGKSILIETTNAADGCNNFLVMLGLCAVTVFFVIISFMVSVPMTFFTFVFGAIASAVYLLAGRRGMRHARASVENTGHIAEQITEIFNNLKYIRASDAMPRAIGQTEKAYMAYRTSNFKSNFYKSGLKFVLDCLSVCLMAGFLAYGFFWSGKGPEFAIVFLAIFYRLVPRIQSIQDAFYTSSLNSVWLSQLQDRYAMLSVNQEIDAGKMPVGRIEKFSFIDVHYEYESRRSVLHNINFTLQTGEIVLLVGDSGSGKSTLIDLTLGLIQPTQGMIALDGQSLSTFSLAGWRSRIGLVLQGSPIFYGSVVDNIALMETQPDREKAYRCAEMADCLDFIQKLPEGFDTLIQEKGSRLSGGQRQRLALARALYRDPWVLILDEPTSELDSESQARIISTLLKLKSQYAILMSSHRAETLSIADKILKLPSGELQVSTHVTTAH
jgi:subfamily B ATP-binding cassette protein MsbA